jgi:drug/metabolite transporter (DMT)-like permease
MLKKNETKKAIYVILWGVLGGLLAIVIAGLVEFISYRMTDTLNVEVVLYATMIFVGVIAGFFIGPVAWHKIYVEGIRGKKYIK